MQMIIFLQRIFYENILRSKKNFYIFKLSNTDLFLCFFVLFKRKFYSKTVDFSRFRTWIVWIQGKNAYHSTTINAQMFLKNMPTPASFSFIFVFLNKQYNSYNK